MKIKCEIEFDTSTGAYDAKFLNVDNPGENIDYETLEKMLPKILADVSNNAKYMSIFGVNSINKFVS